MNVRDIMTSEGLATAALDSTLEEIASMMRDENVAAIPVLDEEDQLAGIITDRDIVVRAIAEGQDPTTCTAEEILSEELHTIEPDASLEEAADLMARHKIRRLLVVEDGTIVGIISLGDISVKGEEEEYVAETLEAISNGNVEGEEELEEQNAGNARRQRANQQQGTQTGRLGSRAQQGMSNRTASQERKERQRGTSVGAQRNRTTKKVS